MNAVRTKFGTMIHDQLSHGTEPPIPFHKLIHHFTVLGIDVAELSAGKNHPLMRRQ